MTKDDFKTLWTTRYPSSIPISYTLRNDYEDRWFRIHSLPDSKRYADNEAEWTTILSRQNAIITDVLGDGSRLLLVTGYYVFEGHEELSSPVDADSIRKFSFTSLDDIDLHNARPGENEAGEVFRPMFCSVTWSPGGFNDLLRDIAQDSVRAFFIAVDTDIIIAPYDGGVDIIVTNRAARDQYKSKYRDWLSKRDDGL